MSIRDTNATYLTKVMASASVEISPTFVHWFLSPNSLCSLFDDYFELRFGKVYIAYMSPHSSLSFDLLTHINVIVGDFFVSLCLARFWCIFLGIQRIPHCARGTFLLLLFAALILATFGEMYFTLLRRWEKKSISLQVWLLEA